MKKYCLMLMVMSLCGQSFSQTFHWKPSLGINSSLQNVSSTGRKKMKIGYDIGIFIEAPLKENISLEMGLLYVQNNASLVRMFIYPFEPVPFDAPQVREDYKLNLFKAPLMLVFSQAKTHPLSFGIGTVVKYNFNAYRSGSVVDRQEKYTSNFTIDTQSESKIGFGIQTAIRKAFSIKNNKFNAGLYYDVDLSKWRYPTNFELEKKTYYSLRSHNFSFMLSYIL